MVRRVPLVLISAVGLVLGNACKGRDDAAPPAAPRDAAIAAVVADAAPVAPDAAPEPPIPDGPVADTAPRRLWTDALPDEAAFLAYSKELGGERFTKFVVDLKSDAIYYFDVDVYRVHKDFIFAELYKRERTAAANRVFDKNYTANKPEFLLCYLVHHRNADVWTMAFWEGDKMTAAHVARAYGRMKATFWNAANVAFRPDSDRQEQVAKELARAHPDIPILTNDRLYKDAIYQAFNPGVAIGTLRLVEAGADPDELTFGPDEIVILPESLPDITPVAGILSETFSTPLAHVSLRARAWGIPNVGLKGAATTYAALVGKTVRFEATEAGHTLREATASEIAEWQDRQQAAVAVVLPEADLARTALVHLAALRAADATAYGAKAANLGAIIAAHPPGVIVPDGIAIPIHHYDAHLAAAGLDGKVTALLADPDFLGDARRRKRELEALRAAIVAAPLDPALLERLVAEVATVTGGDAARGLFVRSSTNAEDLPGFNGAGLYDTVPNVVGTEALATAVKQVWASVWNLRAYEERAHFHIDHTHVHGAVLVQLGIAATAAGVLVTAHPTDPQEKTTYQINATRGLGIRVVEGKRVPESLLYDFHNDGLRVLSRSDEDTMLVFDGKGGVREVRNPNQGKPVLSNARARLLGRAARAIVKVFPRERPLDIEWLFVDDTLYIVQARPYVVK